MKMGLLRLGLAFSLIGNFIGLASEPKAGGQTQVSANAPEYLSPAALAIAPDEKVLFIGCAIADQVLFFDLGRRQITQRIKVPGSPLGLALSRDGRRLHVTCAAPESAVCIVDTASGQITSRIPAGYHAQSPVLSPDERTLYVCNRFNNDVSVINLDTLKETKRVAVAREPIAAALIADGRFLLVANHLQPTGPEYGAIGVLLSVIDVAAGRVSKEIQLTRGANLLKAIAVSPDGRYAAVSHLIARYYLPTREVGAGQMNCNALSIIDLRRQALMGNVLLDEANRGAANPWGVAWAPDGKTLFVSHAGTHEISVVDVPARIARPFRVRQRIAVPGNGPRAILATSNMLYVANYYSDSISAIELSTDKLPVTSINLGPVSPPSLARKGEAWFNDARLCREGWQSCASCHASDARMDAIKWDLLNDGIGNPKNAKSLLFAHLTPPAMARGVRSNAEAAVRAGIQHILFTEQPDEVPQAMMAFLESLQPLPSPHLVDGQLSEAARRGQLLFADDQVGCTRCHKPPWRTDLKLHDVGTSGRYDEPGANQFDTPALIELWRTGPYLHDGAAATVRDVFTTRNPQGRHGKTSQLTEQQRDDLAAYLLSL
jgi:YVTN family beta-propeller protein